MPTLDWIGKRAVVNHHNEVPYKTLELQYTYKDGKKDCDCDESENMIIHGDNLEALKALLPKYEGKVNCIYIDPPYNTGNSPDKGGWIYSDNVDSPQIQKWLGEIVGKETEDLTRHDKWLCMMYPRLKLLHKLLADNGAIFISIDDHEDEHLKVLCSEVFGQSNFVAQVIWERAYSPVNLKKHFSESHDYIICYAKNLSKLICNGLPRTEDANNRYANPDNDPRGVWKPSDFSVGPAVENNIYEITTPSGRKVLPPDGRSWVSDKETYLNLLQENRIWFGEKGNNVPCTKRFLTDVKDGITPMTIWKYTEVGHSQDATKHLKDIFGGESVFPYPKTVELIKRCLSLYTNKDSIILDSFAGSGTTAEAVLELNKNDDGNRKFILVEMENYADKITAERVKRVIDGYPYKGKKEEEIYNQKLTVKNLAKASEFIEEANTIIEEKKEEYDKISNPKIVDNCIKVIGTKVYDEKMDGLGGDFSFYELGEPLMNESGFINENQSLDRIQEYIWYTETHSPFKKNGKNGEYHLGIFNDVSYYFYYEKDRITTLDASFLNQEIKNKADQYIIYADNCLLSDELLKRFNIVFKKIPRDIRQF